MTPPRRDSGAVILIVLGALFLALCGPCTLYFAGSAVIGMVQGPDEEGLGLVILICALVVGGVPTGVGLYMLIAGLRRSRPKPPDTGAFD